jgi:hypothetical protein
VFLQELRQAGWTIGADLRIPPETGTNRAVDSNGM